MERIVEPAVSFGWTEADFEGCLNGMVRIFGTDKSGEIGVSAGMQAKYQKNFTRLFMGVKLSAMRFYKV